MIRLATPDDAGAAIDLIVAAEMFAADETEPVQRLLADYFNGTCGEGHRFLVDADDDAVAIAYYQPRLAADRVWELTMIAVRPSLQGQGRGTALLRHAENALRAAGGRLLLVETSGLPAYVLTRAFYVKCGYEEVASIADYWEPGDALVVLVKML